VHFSRENGGYALGPQVRLIGEPEGKYLTRNQSEEVLDGLAKQIAGKGYTARVLLWS
jgi:hypothetical protein